MDRIIKSGIVALISLIGVVGCGEDEPEDNGTINDQAAQSTASTAFNATQTATGGDGQSGAFAMLGVGTSALGLVTPAQGGETQGVEGIGSVSQAQASEGCSCMDGSCNFDGCDSGSGLLLSGTISWTPTSLDCDYSVAGNQGGSEYSFNIFCDLDYTETSLSGQLNSGGSVNVAAAGANGMSSWDSMLTFNNVTYAGGQPSGGSIDVNASVTTGGETYTASGSVSF